VSNRRFACQLRVQTQSAPRSSATITQAIPAFRRPRTSPAIPDSGKDLLARWPVWRSGDTWRISGTPAPGSNG
jgi:hypothetical protein